MKIIKILFIAIVCSVAIDTNAQSNGDRNISEIEYAVKRIGRIYPTYMWDSWKFRDVMCEKELNTVNFSLFRHST